MNSHTTNVVPPFLYFMIENPLDQDELWLGGLYDSQGTILSFNKEIGLNIKGYRFTRMQEINGYAHGLVAEGDTLFICGTQKSSTDPNAIMRGQLVRMDHDGEPHWYKAFGPTRRRFPHGHSMCRGVAYNQITEVLGIVLEF